LLDGNEKAARTAGRSARRLAAKLCISTAAHFDKRFNQRSNSCGRLRCMRPRNWRARLRTSATTGSMLHNACTKLSWAALLGSFPASFLHPPSSRMRVAPTGTAAFAPGLEPARPCLAGRAGGSRNPAPRRNCRCSPDPALSARFSADSGSLGRLDLRCSLLCVSSGVTPRALAARSGKLPEVTNLRTVRWSIAKSRPMAFIKRP